MKYIYVFLILLCGLLPVSASAKESSVGVIISEVNWAGSAASNADEWIELYNGTSETVDLGGWILAGAATGGDALAIEEGIRLESGEVIVIANYDADSEKSTLVEVPDLVTSSLSLSNSALEILLAMPDGTVVDSVDQNIGSSNPFISMERDLESLEWAEAMTSHGLSDTEQLGTPGIIFSLSSEETEEVVVPENDVDSNIEEDPSTDACLHDIAALQAEILRLESLLAAEEMTTEENKEEPGGTGPDFARQTETEDPQVTEDANDVAEASKDSEVANVAEASDVSEDRAEQQMAEDPDVNEEIESVAYQPGDVILNEFVSNPAEGEEWIELLMMTDVDLNGWTVQDATGKATELEGTHEAEDYFVIEAPKGQLNNSGDAIFLHDASGQLIDSILYGDIYEAPEKGEALARTLDDAWALTTILTPGKQNQFPIYEEQLLETSDENVEEVPEAPTEDAETTSIPTTVIVDIAESVDDDTEPTEEEVVDAAEESPARVQGMVTALPGTFGKQIAFIDGQQLYFYHADWPELAIGDVVDVQGEYSLARGESRLKISHQDDISVIGMEAPVAEEVLIEDLPAISDGALVSITGDFISRDSDTLTLEDATGAIPVIAHANTGIYWAGYDSAQLQITGIVRTIDGEIRLYPRSADDIQEFVEEVMPLDDEMSLDDTIIGSVTDTTSWGPWIGGTIVTATGAILAYWYVKYRLQPNSLPQPV